MRCKAHDLALGPDGRCVLCRRAEGIPARPARQQLVRVLGALVVLLLLGGTGWGFWARARVQPSPAPQPIAAPEPEALIAPAAPEQPEREPRASTDRHRREPETSAPNGAPPAPASVALPAASAEQRAAPPTAAEITRALRTTPVTMFSTQWCGVCERARRFFRANQIPFRERDIDASAADRRELLALTGKTAIPYIDIDGQRISGFGEASALDALRRSVERRLGVKGLRISSSSR